jgi:isoleucyl-tRNA synthetase
MPESVHLCDWPKVEKGLIDSNLNEQMDLTRKICEMGHRLRAATGIKVRQPLKELRIKNNELKDNAALVNLIKDEVNVKKIIFDFALQEEIELETKITPELKDEGLLRELIRQINALRKEAKLTTKDKIRIYYQTDSENLKTIFSRFADELKEATLAQDLIVGESKEARIRKEVKIEEERVVLVLQ